MGRTSLTVYLSADLDWQQNGNDDSLVAESPSRDLTFFISRKDAIILAAHLAQAANEIKPEVQPCATT